MCENYINYNYNNNKLIELDENDVKQNDKIIELLYQYYEKIRGEIIIEDELPHLFINGYKIGKIINLENETNNLYIKDINIRDGKIFAQIDIGNG